MSKRFGITVVVLFVFWLTLVSLAQRKLSDAAHIYGRLIIQHDAELAGVQLRMARQRASAKPTSLITLPAPLLRQQEGRTVVGPKPLGCRC